MKLRFIARLAIMFAMGAAGLLLALNIAYRLRGSLEWFPTAEHETDVRRITTLLAVGFAIAEVGLWRMLRWTTRVSAKGSRPVA